ncbi:MAG: 4-(cytidine 5'-diphospho)-2-C-methyl-D-erythritol kinase [Pyrinomonadaceae bacterium]
MSFTLPSFAKLNLDLRVLGKRDDGYHELFTVFQTVSLCDDISFAEGCSIELTCSDPRIPTDDWNLIVKAANVLRERFAVTAGVALHLRKRIPAPGGLGGGSSNAATALIGLNRLWRLDIGFEEMLDIAVMLGSDVPFFLYGGTAMGFGRGTEIEPIPDISEEYLLIVTPDVHVSTAVAFKELNAPCLTTEASERILINCRFNAESLDLRHTALKNDLEPTVFGTHPQIALAKHTLLGLGAVNALMSGSGASVFAVFDKEETRQTAIKALDEQVNWRKFAAATISRDKYREALELVY